MPLLHSGKTGLIAHLKVSRNASFKYSDCCNSQRHHYSQQGCTVVVHNYHRAGHGSLDDGADRAHSLRKIHRHDHSHLQPLIQQ